MEKTVTLTKKQFYDAGAKAMARICAFTETIGLKNEAELLANISVKIIKIIAEELFEEGEE